jgi:hypothetical protein
MTTSDDFRPSGVLGSSPAPLSLCSGHMQAQSAGLQQFYGYFARPKLRWASSTIIWASASEEVAAGEGAF